MRTIQDRPTNTECAKARPRSPPLRQTPRALACGTPVAGIAAGGVVDAVEHGVKVLAPTGMHY
jgi:hypothetical protein